MNYCELGFWVGGWVGGWVGETYLFVGVVKNRAVVHSIDD